MLNSKYLPVPFFLINKRFQILEYSDEAGSLFACSKDTSILDLADEDSRGKAEKFLSGDGKKVTELAMHPAKGPLSTFKLTIRWDGNEGHLICEPQDTHMEKLLNKVSQQQKRLAETDLELFFQKEALEKSLDKITELSGPAISLTSKLVLIPLFGNLDENLIIKNRKRLLDSLFAKHFEHAILDFHGIGSLTSDGLVELGKLTAEFRLLGVEPVFTGLTPSHVKAMNQSGADLDVPSVSTLPKAIQAFLSK
ncbi:STAS domain-containing protein [Bacillus mangrovi]|uniref:STAS domain-containing protein n=1 Tax=Metabacillus mangrovi TaxID=1491830 RepID=A0A7X2S4R5_9BACI|nr:STAS domain-containing protein [Metabacillus mangrovi]MTH53597.1 STAS domain-containing protein [Metabacillus mangrovi]